jgi:adhesin transport system outer membrane protein
LSPQLNLRVERQWGNHNIINADTENRVFLELSSSFGAGLSIFSKIERAKLEERSILLDLETQNKKTITEFENDWLSYQSLSKQNKLLESALLTAQKIQRSWYRQFLAGRKQWQDVMNSIREVAQLKAQIANTVSESLLVSWRLAIRIKGVGAI